MVAFAHALETLLDLLRDGRIELRPEIIALLLRTLDILSDLVAAERANKAAAPGYEDALLQELVHAATLISAEPAQGAARSPVLGAPARPPEDRQFRILFRPHANLFQNAHEPLYLIRELRRLGTVDVKAELDRLPLLGPFDAESAYIGWTIEVTTNHDAARIQDVFDFVSDDCDLTIQVVDAEGAAPESAERLCPDQSVPPKASSDSASPAAPLAPMNEASQETRKPAATVRVDVEKVDRLVNLVGEMVINQAMLVQCGATLPPESCAELVNGLETLSQHLRELQDGVMAIRTQAVRSVFSRMPRLIRELSGQLGKEVRLVVSGEATEIDKTVIEQLADPLTHLLRNALDHGIEGPDERLARGKPRQGTIHLAAEHRSGRIVIEVSDDGKGIDRPKVLARARERGLMSAASQPSEEEIDNLIFLPGFSTADVVSNVSGRGVGMDVVRRNIQALGGRISVQSRFGAGSRFLLSLPLTLAILDGMIVAVGNESYIIPLANIVESLRPKPQEIHAVAGSGDVVAIRGEYVPLIYLSRHFCLSDAIHDASRGVVVVVENESAGPVGLVVDELLGQQQVVVKSLEANYGAVHEIGGATILGNGRVALILDVAGLRDRAASAAQANRTRIDRPALLLKRQSPTSQLNEQYDRGVN